MRNAKLYAVFVVLFGIAAFAYLSGVTPHNAWNALFSQGYAYTESAQGILFASNEGVPTQLLSLLSAEQSFIISPHMVLGNSPLNTAAANLLIQDQIVLSGHRKSTLTVIRVFDSSASNGKWVSCQTDFGSGKDNETISVSECVSLLDAPNSVVLELDFPNASQSRPIVELSSKKVTIKPVKDTDVSGVNFLFLRGMFPDAGELIDSTNRVVAANQK